MDLVELAALLSGDLACLDLAELAFSKVFPRPQGVLARPISGRTGTRRVLAWAKPILCTAPSAVLELARVVLSELAALFLGDLACRRQRWRF
jgi:hypothetical protein